MGRSCLGWGLVGIFFLFSFSSCGCSRFPDGPDGVSVSAGSAGSKAIKQYDANGDGVLDSEELDKSPPLKLARDRIDVNGDGKLTATEIANRVTVITGGAKVVTGDTLVLLDKAPLEGATVTFEPESFLGSGYEPCKAITDERGEAYVTREKAKFPGIYKGLYRVKISKMVDGKESIPAKYNTETILGYETADDIEGVGNIKFELESK